MGRRVVKALIGLANVLQVSGVYSTVVIAGGRVVRRSAGWHEPFGCMDYEVASPGRTYRCLKKRSPGHVNARG